MTNGVASAAVRAAVDPPTQQCDALHGRTRRHDRSIQEEWATYYLRQHVGYYDNILVVFYLKFYTNNATALTSFSSLIDRGTTHLLAYTGPLAQALARAHTRTHACTRMYACTRSCLHARTCTHARTHGSYLAGGCLVWRRPVMAYTPLSAHASTHTHTYTHARTSTKNVCIHVYMHVDGVMFC